MKNILLMIFINVLVFANAAAAERSWNYSGTNYVSSFSKDAGIVNQLIGALSDQLTQNKDFLNVGDTPIAITSFVCSEHFGNTTRLSNILSENLIHEMQIRGYKIIDFKTMDDIKIDESGDFLFSRNVDKLRKTLNVNYALTGTYTEYRDGTVVNARIIDLKTHVVMSTAQVLIPRSVVKHIMSRGHKMVDFTPHSVNLSRLH